MLKTYSNPVLTKAQAEVATKHRAVSEATAEEAKDYYGVA